MLNHILQPIEEALHSVHHRISRQLIIRAGDVGAFAHLEFSQVNKSIRPALVLLSSRMYNANPEKAVFLASVTQFIYMASSVHQNVPESDSDYIRGGSDPRDGSQFPVLVGDFLYGKFFTFLCDAGIIELLEPLAEIICQIHEGSIIRKKAVLQGSSSQPFYEAVRKETAVLFAGCCSLGARLGGVSEQEQQLMGRFGLNFGMAFGLLEQNLPVDSASVYLEEASNALRLLPERMEKSILKQLVNYLSCQGLTDRRMVI